MKKPTGKPIVVANELGMFRIFCFEHQGVFLFGNRIHNFVLYFTKFKKQNILEKETIEGDSPVYIMPIILNK